MSKIKNALFSFFLKIKNGLSGFGLGNLRIVKKIKNYIFMKTKPEFLIIDNHKIYLDKYDSLKLTKNPDFDPYLKKIIKKEVKKGDKVIDIGANIGYFTLFLARLVGPSGTVYAFEPEQENYELLKKNVKVNGYKNVVIIKKAVSDKTGKTILTKSDYNASNHTIGETNDNKEKVIVQTIRLDDYFKGKKIQIDFIKMDIEGAEPSAYKGMPKLVKKSKNLVILTEVLPLFIKKFNTTPEKYLQSLKKHFTIYNVDEDNFKTFKLKNDKIVYNKLEYTNWLCKKK